ncbi:signal-transducing adaptor protein 2b [Brachyhypopomus gauderio]|uniref:signal-transducing adaptor protein 2b n=1 Tax=Brachyhypopomus gauderio TaxID=698409 RepID=UPI004042EB25
MATGRRPGRSRCQLPTCYHEGFLEKRSFKDKMSRRLWTCLCGNSLFFFHNSKDNNYVEKLELDECISVSDDTSLDRNLDAARFQLQLKGGSIQLTAPSLEAREVWKGFIYCIAKLEIPSSFNLLPGQLHLLKEVVETERKRRKQLPEVPEPAAGPGVLADTPTPGPPIYTDVLAEMPVCYYQISRGEAEILLDRNQDKGNLLLRQGRDGSSLAVSTRQDFNGTPVFRHYRVTRQHDGGFAIAVENPISCETLHDVIDCLVQKTEGALKPLTLEQPYEKNITFVKANAESGEKSMEEAPSCPENTLPAVPPKPAPRAAVSPANPKPSPEESGPEESLYLNASDEEPVVNPPVPPRSAVRPMVHQNSLPVDAKTSTEMVKVPLLPPVRTKSPATSHHPETPAVRPKSRVLQSEFLPQNLAEELKLKVLKRTLNDQLTN